MDCQCSSCFVLVQSLITTLVTIADIQSTGSDPISGYEEPCLAISSVVSFPSITMCTNIHTIWILLCSAIFTRDWWQSQTNLEFIWKLSCTFDGCLTVGKNVDVSTCVAIFCSLHYTNLNGVFFSVEYGDVESKTETVLPSGAPSIHPSINAIIGLGPIYVPDHAHSVVWVECHAYLQCVSREGLFLQAP